MSESLQDSGVSLIRKRLKQLSGWFEHPLVVPVTLFVVAFACYGLLINRLGYYWDDFPLTYIKNIYGSAGLARYFSTNRPIWGLLYQITFNIFDQPWQWQLNAFLWRWLSSVFLWLLLREIWPNRKKIAIWASILFLVYPGFKQQHISVIYSNLFIVLDCFLLSLYFNIKAIRRSNNSGSSRIRWLWQAIAIGLSLYNLLALEYFYALDLLRPIFIWLVLAEENKSNKTRIKGVLLNWSPYLVLWGLVTIWRVFFFGFQTHNYQILFFQSLQESPINAIITLIKAIGNSLWVVFIQAWAQVFTPPDLSQLGLRTTIGTVALIIVISLLMISYFLLYRDKSTDQGRLRVVLWIGIIACILGGVPWWLTGLPPSLRFPSDRFTLPFILGVSLLVAWLLSILPLRWWIQSIILSILIGFAVGSQFQVVNQFRRDWETQRRFFWQLAWRVPALEPGTTLMVNDLPVTYYSDNSLTAPLNWFWASQNNTPEMSYLLLYPSQRLGNSLVSLKPGVPISVDYLAAKFTGSTSNVVSVSYDPPACVRVLDRALDSDNRMLSMEMQAAAALSSTEWIYTEGKAAGDILPNNLYAPEPSHGWCYYFEMADLARQDGNWEVVANLGDIAFTLNDYPNDPMERFPFIEGYAHVGNWERALELTEQSQGVTEFMEPLLCRLWQRIDRSTTETPEKDGIITAINTELDCAQ